MSATHVRCPQCGDETVLHEGGRVRCICGEEYPRLAGELAYERAHPAAREAKQREIAEMFDPRSENCGSEP